MRTLNKKQKTLLNQFIKDYYKGSGGNYPHDVDDINPVLWSEIEQTNDHETLYQNANRYINDQVMTGKYQRPNFVQL
uniref:Uncharacterized protein n=1 Tax=viral metagenome TaxID=1070528 RepID=A0A6H2A6P3_9ZZZZ